MKSELTRIEPLRAANVMALVYGILMTAMMLILVPIMLIVVGIAAIAQGQAGAGLGEAMGVLVVFLLYPILGLVFGWISGLIASWAYNLIAGWIGGIRYETHQVDRPGAPLGQTTPV